MSIKTLFSVLCSGLIISCGSLTAPTIDECNNLYANYYYEQYVNQCSKLARNDAVTQYNLYQIYKNGTSGKIDMQMANYFLLQSASLGYPEAMLDSCAGYYTGSIGIKSNERVLYWCDKAFQHGMTEAATYLADVYYRQGNYTKALDYFLAQPNPSPKVDYQIGQCYLKTSRDIPEAYEWIRKAYQKNNPEAKHFVHSISHNYGKCSIEDAYFDSDLSYYEALDLCKEVNNGEITTGRFIHGFKKMLRTW